MRSRPTRVWGAVALPCVLSCALAVAGCSSSGPVASSYMASADAGSGEFASTRPVRGADLTMAIASMPEPGGSQLTMREKFYANGVKQDIVLAGDKTGFGENLLQVAVQSAPASAGGRDQVPLYRPTESGIKNEIIARYPKVDMQILTQPRRNVLGTFGLAIGRHASGVRCVFAWQWIDDVRNPGGSSSSFSKFGGSSGQPATVRVHLCRKDATVDELAAAVEGLTLASPSVIDRVLDTNRTVAPVAATSRVSGGSGVQVASDGSLESALSTAVRPGRATQVAATEAQQSPVAPARRRVARVARKREVIQESEAQQSPVAPAAPVYQNGPRYLAPIAGAPAGASYGTAMAGGAAPAYATPAYGGGSMPSSPTKTLDPSLPAAAYRGPNGGR